MEFYVGQIIIFGGNFPIRSMAFAQGQLLPIAQNTALFSLYGTMYGGDGRTTFALPDLRGRSPIGTGNGPGLPSYNYGQKGGRESITLTQSELPTHSHNIVLHAANEATVVDNAEGNFLANEARGGGDVPTIYTSASSPLVNMNSGSATAADTGGNQAFNSMNPYLAITFQVALTGLYPSRN